MMIALAGAALANGCSNETNAPAQTSAAADSVDVRVPATESVASTAATAPSSPVATESTASPVTTVPAPKLADVATGVQALLGASLQPGALDWTQHDVDVPATGVAIGIRVRGNPDMILSAGTEADRTTPFDPDRIFSIATIGSSMTQDLAFQLIREGTLDATAPLSTWFPNYPNAKLITVQMLLDESNGMGDFNARMAELLLADPGRAWTLEEVLDEAATQPTKGTPGVFDPTSHATGIIAVGRIMELVTGLSLADLYRTRITEPLGLAHTVVSDGSPADNIQPGFFVANGAAANTADYPRTAYVTFGRPIWGVDSTVEDLLTYLDAAVNGSPKFGVKLTEANFPMSRLNEVGLFINGTGTGWNGFCPCQTTQTGATVTFVGRGPSSVGTTIQIYDYVSEGVSIVVHYNSSELESFEQLQPMIEQIKAMVAPFAS